MQGVPWPWKLILGTLLVTGLLRTASTAMVHWSPAEVSKDAKISALQDQVTNLRQGLADMNSYQVSLEKYEAETKANKLARKATALFEKDTTDRLTRLEVACSGH